MRPSEKIGDPSLARDLIEKFSDIDGLTFQECEELGLVGPPAQVLVNALGTGRGGILTGGEQAVLRRFFADTFVEELTGQPADRGTSSDKPLAARFRWLKNHSVWRSFRFNRSEEERALILQELGSLGPYAIPAIPEIVENLAEDSPALRGAAATALGEIPETARSVVPLILALTRWPPHERHLAAASLVRKGTVAAQVLVMHLATNPLSWQMRYTFLELLGKIGPPASPVARSVVQQHLHHRERWVRVAAAWALGRMREAKAVPSLIAALGDQDPDVSQAAASALVAIGPAAIEGLTAALRNPGEATKIRRQAALLPGLIKTGERETILTLIQSTADPDPVVQKGAVDSLIRIGAAAAPLLMEKIWDPNPLLRQKILFLLGEIRPEGDEAVPLISSFLSDDHERVRREAAVALGKFAQRARSAVDALVSSLDDKEQVLREVIEALVRIGGEATPELLKVLEDERESVRLSAAAALVRIGAPAIPRLVEHLSHRSRTVRETVASILLKIGLPAVPSLIGSLDHPSEQVREKCAELLGQIEATEEDRRQAAAKLVERLGREDPQLHDTLVTALVQIGLPAVPLLVRGLEENNPTVRELSARALGEITLEPQSVVPALIQRLRDTDPVRRAAIGALVRFGSFAVPELVTSLWEEEPMREAALEALVGIGRPAVGLLIRALSADRESVRVSAHLALGRIGRPSIQPLIRRLREMPVPFDLMRIIAETLARIGLPAVDPMTRALAIPDPTIQQTLAMGLGIMGPLALEAHPALTRTGSTSRHPAVQREVAKALIKIGHPGLNTLIAQLSDPNPQLREFAALTLEEIGPQAQRAIPALIEREKDPEQSVQEAAGAARERIGPAPFGSLPDLIRLMDDPDPTVRLGSVGEIVRMARSDGSMRRRLGRRQDLARKLKELQVRESPEIQEAAQTASGILTTPLSPGGRP